MVKRRCEHAGLPADICNHYVRATGITIHQERGGAIQEAAKLAGNKNVRTTQLSNSPGRYLAHAAGERVPLSRRCLDARIAAPVPDSHGGLPSPTPRRGRRPPRALANHAPLH